MNPVMSTVALAAAATITAVAESQRQKSSALMSVATSEAERPPTSCFHSHFRSQLLDDIPFDNVLFDGGNENSGGNDDDGIHPHLWSKRHYSDPPVECRFGYNSCSSVNSKYECTLINGELLTRLYGPRYAHSEHKVPSFIFNGIPVGRGKSYCLPKDLTSIGNPSGGVCDHVTGDLEITYDVSKHRFVPKCFCKWPDFFAGPMCDKYVGCKVDQTSFGWDMSEPSQIKRGNAMLINRDTQDQIMDIDDLYEVWKRREGNIDLYATSRQLDQTPAWYCGCKKVDANLTGGIIGGSCIADPCLPSSNYMHLDPHKAMLYSAAIGTLDSRDTKLAGWNCDCGDPTKSWLFGGGDTPCAPLVNTSDYQRFDIQEIKRADGDIVRTIHNVKCKDENKIFLQCWNGYRPMVWSAYRRAPQGHCSDIGFPGIVNPRELPDAGACVDVCGYCNAVFRSLGGNGADSDLCSRDSRTVGRCLTNHEWNNKFPVAANQDTKVFVACIFAWAYAIPMALIVYFYSQLFKSVRRHEKMFRDQAKKMNVKSLCSKQDKERGVEMRIAKVAFTIFFFFVCSWTPYAIVAMTGAFGNRESLTPFSTMLPAVFAKTVSCIDPRIYAINHPRYSCTSAQKILIPAVIGFGLFLCPENIYTCYWMLNPSTSFIYLKRYRQELQKRCQWMGIHETEAPVHDSTSAITEKVNSEES